MLRYFRRVTIIGMSEAAAAPVAEPRPPRKLYRSSDGRWLGGVARGLAGHLGLPVIWVRLVFVGLFMADGLGALLYAAFWFSCPWASAVWTRRSPPSPVTAEASPDGRRRLVTRRPDKGRSSPCSSWSSWP
ncbi:hypothetical protein GCM10023238_18940 [Streptomyces heliomycini]